MSNIQTVVITGASRGIGAACARLFAAKGWQVVIGYYKSEEKALQLEKELQQEGCRAKAIKADVTDRLQVENFFNQVHQEFGAVDALVNNAGISQFQMFTDITEEQWDLMMDTNCKGMYLCCRCALPPMISEKRGSIINVSSIWGQVGSSCEVHYSASKAAVIGLTKALAKELGPSNIRVNCIAPGVIETDMLAEVTEEIKEGLREETPLMRLGTTADIANAVYFLATSQSAFMTGQVMGVNGGFVIG